MLVFGLCGGDYSPTDPVTRWPGHDAATAVVADGEFQDATGEERLTPGKHANWFPTRAVNPGFIGDSVA
jgi:predicted NodU family carbamoyl transferase